LDLFRIYSLRKVQPAGEPISVTPEIIGELTVDILFNRWPQTIEVFQRHHMACVGCVVAPFCHVNDAIVIYNLSPQLFLAELKAVIDQEAARNEVQIDE
jgi:hybrid cluster-associated redox disulfide protein